jgi:hypothetical protein
VKNPCDFSSLPSPFVKKDDIFDVDSEAVYLTLLTNF